MGRESSTTAPISFSKRKPALPMEEVAPASAAATTKATSSLATQGGGEEELSSSPEKPYQGVGRLIDQWQRKTESNEPKPSPPGVVKRAGLVGGSNRF
jgi:AP2-associated kinase